MSKWMLICAAIGAATAAGESCGDGKCGARTVTVKASNKPRPEAVQFIGSAFSTDLPLAESKQPVHRLWLTCRLVDGGAGVLTLDPNVPRFDEFGDQVRDARLSPLLRLKCTLKFLKKDKQRTLYEIRGPKIVSRLSLVAYNDIMPWGDGRLLVGGKGGKVRYVIDLFIPRPKPSPPRSAVNMPPP